MDRINLIPDDIAITWTDRALSFIDRRFVQVLGVSVAAMVVIELAVAGSQALAARRDSAKAKILETKRTTLVAELENARAYLTQLDQVEGQLKQQMQWLAQRIAYLSAYREMPTEWAQVLQEIKTALPYGVWLTELESGARGGLRLAGGAFDNALVTQLMSHLKASPSFTSVAFNYTKVGQIGKATIIDFEISCQITSSAGQLLL